jgi:NADPH-dependent F420 reductase
MRIAIIGGTGKEGAGLATRWALAGHDIIIGSRNLERAKTKAAEVRARTSKIPIVGEPNREAAQLGAVIVIAVPWTGLGEALPELATACQGKVVVSTVVPLTLGGPRLFTPPPIGSAAEETQKLLGAGARVVAAFHHIAAHELADSERPIECDLLLCGGDAEAKQTVTELGASLSLRVIDAGPLSNAGPLEGLTALLATINRRYRIKDSGIRITGLG